MKRISNQIKQLHINQNFQLNYQTMSAPNQKQITLNKFLGVPTSIKPITTQSNIDNLFSKPKKQKTNEENETKSTSTSNQLKRSCSPEEKDQQNGTNHGSKPKKIKSDSETNSALIESKLVNQTNQSLQIEKDQTNRNRLDSKDHGQVTKIDDEDKITKSNNKQEASTEVAENENDEEDEEDEDEEDETGEGLVDIINEDDGDDKTSWAKGTPIPYSSLVHTFTLIDGTTKRLEITKYLSQYLMKVINRTPNELIKIIYLCINRLCPDYEGIELGIGESILIKAIGSSMGRTPTQVKADFKKVGDLGLVAQNSRSTQKTMFKPKVLTVNSVYQDLKTIATTSGHSSQAKKVGIITKMLAACQGEEAKYIIRSLEGKLRIGLAERTVLVALATAVVTTGVGTSNPTKRKSKETLSSEILEGTNLVKSVFSEIPSYDLVIPALLKGGIKGLRENCKLTPGVPLKPMLAKPTKSISEVLDRFEGQLFTCEYKYDGERAQIHYLEDGTISIFSRNSENMSEKYPDMLDQMKKSIKTDITKSFVLDSEVVAWDPILKKILPFQELSKRKRKDVKASEINIKIKIFGFDLLYLNDEALIKTDLKYRRSKLKEHFNEIEDEFNLAKSLDSDKVEEIQVFLDESIKASCEGLMVKMLNGENAYYEPSRRSMNWLKVKKDYLAGLGDSLDLVVIGAYFGKGKRTNVYGAFLLGIYDQSTESYQSICKIGTGFTDEVLESHYQKLKPLELLQKKSYYDTGDAKPDVWVDNQVVWEVLAADLSLSPIYSAARGLCGDGTRGISLRFPRYIRERDDKGPEDGTGPDQVAEMYERQVSTQTQGSKGKSKKKEGEDDDFW